MVTLAGATSAASNVSTGRPGAAASKAPRELKVMVEALAAGARMVAAAKPTTAITNIRCLCKRRGRGIGVVLEL